MEYKLDMSMMFAMHDALRRELVQVARIAGQRNGHPGTQLHAALGWELFKRFLLVHHRSEDDALWPVLRAHVADKPDRVALEAEHTAIDPLLTAIDAAARQGKDRDRPEPGRPDHRRRAMTGRRTHTCH
jgi:hypothetical protein